MCKKSIDPYAAVILWAAIKTLERREGERDSEYENTFQKFNFIIELQALFLGRYGRKHTQTRVFFLFHSQVMICMVYH